MDYLVNDCSLHSQFATHAAFVEALRGMLKLRERLRRAGRVLRAPRAMLRAAVVPGETLQQVVNAISDKNLRNAVIVWMAKEGPFWDDEPLHDPDDWFEDRKTGQIVTETGLAEAAMGVLHGLSRALVSFEPSAWTYTPVEIDHVTNAFLRRTVTLDNHWTLSGIEQQIHATRGPLDSWEALVRWAREECQHLSLTPDVIRWLDGHPFLPGAAQRFQVLLATLDKLRSSFGPEGALTEEGRRLQQAHFVGDKAWFSDSSDGEKADFRNELTFPNPEGGATSPTVFCPWHGKVKIAQMRVHFTYPIRHDRPLFVVYIGPKLTKR